MDRKQALDLISAMFIQVNRISQRLTIGMNCEDGDTTINIRPVQDYPTVKAPGTK